ncbi:YdeI/OmpD-associated family protein [Paenibacillus favisporus]|nr:YdeI/OmpD-associated family protein [Paenibacillus favisporus]MEC0176788.1 YdeI/OmpD-associated family protein [Paenibacillus favisporus]
MEGLSYSNKCQFMLNIHGAKYAKTRQQRFEKFIELLREDKLQQ